MTETVGFSFDGTPLTCDANVSVAAALTRQGIRRFRRTDGGAERGMFCGMGVCQECLVTIGGEPNQRACMTTIVDGMRIETQAARAPLSHQATMPKKAEHLSPDILIIGGGAGGLNAGIAARLAGADVMLLDERKVTGGQYFKQSAVPSAAPLDRQQAEGADLVARARASGVHIISSAEVWAAFNGPQIMASTPSHAYVLTPRAVIVATGAYERPAMIPGWTLPGVMTVGAAQTLWRSYRELPGKRVAIFGNGPLCAQVALELSKGGAEIAILGETASPAWTRPGAAMAMAIHGSALAAKGVRMLADLRRRRIPITWRTQPIAIEKQSDALTVHYRVGKREHDLTVDAVCLNFGFLPQNEILRLLGARMRFDATFEQLRPEQSTTMETSASGVYAVGDCCGLGGAPAAAVEGQIAGRAAAGAGGPTKPEIAALRRHRKFQSALWRVYAADVPGIKASTPDTLICRCEEVTRAALDDALAAGAMDIGAVKRATRIGMGRCQGRYCAPAVAGYLGQQQNGEPEDLSFFAPRVPIKPIDIATVAAAAKLLKDAAVDG